MRRARLNPTAIGTFSLIGERPMLTTDVMAKLGAFFVANQSAQPNPRATKDPKPCPHCNGPVEWCLTATTRP